MRADGSVADEHRAHGDDVGELRSVGVPLPDLLDQQVEEVAEVYALKFRPSPDAIYNLSFLPPRAERTVSA